VFQFHGRLCLQDDERRDLADLERDQGRRDRVFR
jgi:hypothetical protein